eukprot:70986-Rhodomonas_salina.3
MLPDRRNPLRPYAAPAPIDRLGCYPYRPPRLLRSPTGVKAEEIQQLVRSVSDEVAATQGSLPIDERSMLKVPNPTSFG